MKIKRYKIVVGNIIFLSILITFSISGLFYRIFYYLNQQLIITIAVIILLMFSGILFYGENYISKFSKKYQVSIILWISVIADILMQMIGGINSIIYPVYFGIVAIISLLYGPINSILSSLVFGALEGSNILLNYKNISLVPSTKANPQITNFLFKLLFLILISQILGFISSKKTKDKKKFAEKLSALETGMKTILATKEIFDKEIFNSSIEKKDMRISRSLMTLDESLGLITNLALTSIDSFTCAIFLTSKDDSNHEKLKLYKFSSKSQLIKDDADIESKNNLIGLCFFEEKQVSIQNLSENTRNSLPYYKKAEDIYSFLSIPIFGYEKIEGVLTIDSKTKDAFGPKEHSIFHYLGREVAIALYHARNLNRTEDKAKELAALYEASKALSTPINVESILNTIITVIEGIINYNSCYIALVNETDGKISIKLAKGLEKNFSKNFDIEKDNLIHWAKENKQSVLTKSFLITPMIVKDKVIGIIKLDSKKQDIFTEYDQEIISIFSNQAAIAIEHASLYEKTIHMATTDGLTGLYNHRYFQERLSIEISKAERKKTELTLILCDIDFFKAFNDTYGHLEGDNILKKLADQLKEDFKDAIISRYGGEEFAVILPSIDKSTTFKLAENFRKNVEKNFYRSSSTNDMNVTISIGIASYPSDSKDQRNLIHSSDLALYRAKETERNKTCVFES